MRRLFQTLLACVAVLVCAAPAHAGFFPATPIDGPSADILGLGDLDISRDGQGAVVYLRSDAGTAHVYASRFTSGRFQGPQQLDPGLAGVSSQPVIAAADGGRVAAAYINGGTVYVTVFNTVSGAWSPPQPLADAASDPSIDLSIHGAGFVTFTSAGDVRAARLERTTLQFTLIPSPLDINASDGSGRSHVAIGADSTAVAVWSEGGHVYERRLYRTSISAAPEDLTAASVDGHVGGAADLPDVDIEDDSSFAQVVFRQQFDNGAGVLQARAVARRLRGSAIGDPVLVDGADWGADQVSSTDVDLNGRGEGIATIGLATGVVTGSVLKDDAFSAGVTLGFAGGLPAPAGAASETSQRVVSWIQASDQTVHGRFYDDRQSVRTIPLPGPDTVVSAPDLGGADPAGGIDVASDRVGDFMTVFIQGTGANRRLVAAPYDRLPTTFSLYSRSSWRNPNRTPLSWSEATDLWGGVDYAVSVDGKEIGRTRAQSFTIPPTSVVPDGVHTWKVTAIDQHGQIVSTPVRPLQLDSLPPTVLFSIHRKKRKVTVDATVADQLPPSGRASGVSFVRIDFGDRSGVVQARSATHTYGSSGRSFTIRVSATDKAGNATALTRVVTFPKAKKKKAEVDAEALIDGLALRGPGASGAPRTIGIMVASADGRATVDGRAGGLGHPDDRALLRGLRARADAVLVGSRTIGIEGYGSLVDADARDRRVAAGQPPHPLVVTISRQLDLDWDAALFAEAGVPVLIFTSALDDVDVPRVAASVEVERFEPGALHPAAVLDRLRDRGIAVVACEGGPSLLGELVAADCLDDLLLTIAPLLVAGQGPHVTEHGAFTPVRRMSLQTVERSDDHLFLHYRPAPAGD